MGPLRSEGGFGNPPPAARTPLTRPSGPRRLCLPSGTAHVTCLAGRHLGHSPREQLPGLPMVYSGNKLAPGSDSHPLSGQQLLSVPANPVPERPRREGAAAHRVRGQGPGGPGQRGGLGSTVRFLRPHDLWDCVPHSKPMAFSLAQPVDLTQKSGGRGLRAQRFRLVQGARDFTSHVKDGEIKVPVRHHCSGGRFP